MVALVAVLAFSGFRLSMHGHLSNAKFGDVTLPACAESLDRALHAISLQTSKPLRADAQVGQRIVALRLAGAGEEAVMNNIAGVMDCRWEDRGSHFLLTRDRSREVQHRANALALRAQELRRSVAKLVTERAPYLSPSQESVAEASSRIQAALLRASEGYIGPGLFDAIKPLPQGGLIAALVSAIPVKELAEIPPGGRVVYSSQPNALQRSLPGSARHATELFFSAYGQFWEKLHRPSVEFFGRTPNLHIPELSGFEQDSSPREGETKILLSASRANSPSLTVPLLDIRLLLYEASTKPFLNSDLVIVSSSPSSLGRASGPNLSFSEESRELVRFEADLRQGKRSRVSARLRSALLHPLVSDPLALVPCDLLSGIATAKGKSIVAWLPDVAFADLMPDTCPISLGQAETLLSRCTNVTCDENAAWLRISPSDPEVSEEHFASRRSLETLMSLADLGDPMPLAATINFLEANPGFCDADKLAMSISEIIGGPDARLSLQFGSDWIRLYASVRRSTGSDQQDSAVIQASQLDSQGQLALERLLRGPDSHIERGRPGISYAAGSEFTPAYIEPTEVLGQEGSEIVKVRVQPEGTYTTVRFSTSSSDLIRYVTVKAMSEGYTQPDTARTDTAGQLWEALAARSLQWLQPITKTRLRVVIDIGNDLGFERSIVSPLAQGPKVKAPDSLPKEYRFAPDGGIRRSGA